MATRCVEVSDSFGSLVRDAYSLQIFFDHQPGSSLRQFRKKNLIWWYARDPFSDQDDKLRVDRQHVLFSVLGAGGFDGQRGRVCRQCKTSGSEAGDFFPTQSREGGENVNPRPFLSAEALDVFTALAGGLNELGELFGVESTTLMSNVDFSVEPGETNNGKSRPR